MFQHWQEQVIQRDASHPTREHASGFPIRADGRDTGSNGYANADRNDGAESDTIANAPTDAHTITNAETEPDAHASAANADTRSAYTDSDSTDAHAGSAYTDANRSAGSGSRTGPAAQ